MKLKNKSIHYNVKYLSGYGISIKQKNNQIILNHKPDPFSDQDREEWFVTNLPYEKLVVSGNGYITFDALKSLAIHNRNLILTDTSGKPVCLINGLMDSLTSTKYRIGQYDTFRDEPKRQYLTSQITKAKIESQSNFLKSHGIDADLSKFESASSKRYFAEYSKLIPKKYQFHSRNQSFIRNTKNHATDVINSLLNYGYSVLAGEISKFVCGLGLDPYYGFMHKTHTGFMPLVYDLIEPFRWMVDEAVLHMATTTDKRKRIRLKDYAFANNGQIVLEYRLKQNFLEKLERLFQKERPYPFKHGRNSNSLSMCQEITIAKLTVQSLADYCCGNSKSFLASIR